MERYQLIQGDCLHKLKLLEPNSIDALVCDPPAGISFMGKEWDKDKGGSKEWINWMTEVMRECRRVLKPGAHGFVWAIPRTSHWTAMACEWAGFQIRDVVVHLFGSGFPKSLDISKAIDKAQGTLREVLRTEKRYDKRGGRQHAGANQKPMDWDITIPACDEAKQWEGWGTALKPASEHWILIRKPLEGSVAENIQEWGVGGINIEASRIGNEKRINTSASASASASAIFGTAMKRGPSSECLGRFPANVILDEAAAEMLDAQSGVSPSNARNNKGEFAGYGSEKLDSRPEYKLNDIGGGASRFFYCSKTSRHEREAGMGEREAVKLPGRSSQSIPEALNHHPTVKSFRLMRYLTRMITPPGGTVLDCFMGSGTTGAVAVACGFKFIGIEQDPEFFDIASKRIADVRYTETEGEPDGETSD